MSSNVHSIISNKVMTLLNGVTSTGASDSQLMPAAKVTFQVTGITTATVLLQGSHDDTNWVTLATATSDDGYVLTDPWKYIRVNVSVYTAGTITTTVGW